jgi:hypothetical protein
MKPDPEVLATAIEVQAENQPNDPEQPIHEIWQDYNPEKLDRELADLWRWGVIEASVEDGEQFVQLSVFGEELEEKGMLDDYITLKLGELPEVKIPEKPGVRVLE